MSATLHRRYARAHDNGDAHNQNRLDALAKRYASQPHDEAPLDADDPAGVAHAAGFPDPADAPPLPRAAEDEAAALLPKTTALRAAKPQPALLPPGAQRPVAGAVSGTDQVTLRVRRTPALFDPHLADTATATASAPVTMQRPLPTSDLDEAIPCAWLARATRAVDAEHPRGSEEIGDADADARFATVMAWGAGRPYPNADMTVLQQHVAFWDEDGDGEISMRETYRGFRRLGFNVLYSLLAVFFINGTMSYGTRDSKMPDPFFRVKVRNVHKCKHGSDSGVLDYEGRFIPAKFEELFTKYAKTSTRYMTGDEVWAMTNNFRQPFDIYGWCAAKLEWLTLLLLIGETDPATGKLVLTKERVRSQYDGTLFYALEAERNRALAQGEERKQHLLAQGRPRSDAQVRAATQWRPTRFQAATCDKMKEQRVRGDDAAAHVPAQPDARSGAAGKLSALKQAHFAVAAGIAQREVPFGEE